MNLTELKEFVESAFKNANLNQSKIDQGICNMDGLSGIKTRHFYNNILNRPDARYLEIGTWKGSSVCAAMCNNEATIYCIDNWSQFGGPKIEFINNFNTYKGKNNATFLECDCFSFDTSILPKFNTYMYDGDHDISSHYKALTYFINCMDDIFVFIVDDWNWKYVRDGTNNAIKDLNLEVLFEIDHRTTNNDECVVLGSQEQREWHNGIYIVILKKPN